MGTYNKHIMGKSIRSKNKKESRTQLRNTIGKQAADTAFLSTQSKLKECINQKTTSIDRLAKLFNNEENDDDDVKVVVMDVEGEEGQQQKENKSVEEKKQVVEEEIYVDKTRIPGKKIYEDSIQAS